MASCSTCGAKLISGSFFCDSCGANLAQGKSTRKLRQTSFDSIKDAKEGLLSAGERIKGKQIYIIEEAIARSGFGATFRAIRLKDEKQVLIKQMIDQPHYDQFKSQLLKSFKREAKFLSKIKHPAFPRGFEYFQKHKSFYLVMEFINGKDLYKAIEEYRSKTPQVEDGLIIHLGIEIADALEIVHQSRFVYRDLKPQNVMLDGVSRRVKLIDFGTLYSRSDSNPLLFESEGYTPPEFMDKTKKFLPSGDVYSLGALLYELAEGQTPPKGGGGKLSDKNRDPRLVAIINQCLELDPKKRYQRASQVRQRLFKLTKKGFLFFGNKNPIAPVELAVLPKTLYPPTCTFCDYCGFADGNSQAGYCPSCRIPLRVGRLVLITQKNKKEEKAKEFFLYADETIVGSSNQAHFSIGSDEEGVQPKQFRIFRRKTGLWLESLDKSGDTVLLNKRKVLGPVELFEEDQITVGKIELRFDLKDAC